MRYLRSTNEGVLTSMVAPILKRLRADEQRKSEVGSAPAWIEVRERNEHHDFSLSRADE